MSKTPFLNVEEVKIYDSHFMKVKFSPEGGVAVKMDFMVDLEEFQYTLNALVDGFIAKNMDQSVKKETL